MDGYEEDFVIVYKEDVLNETIGQELKKEINTSEHLSNAFISNDEAIARELQNQIDKEYNENLKRLEMNKNGMSKLNISYEKYRKYDNYSGYDEFNPPDNIDSIQPCGYLFNKEETVLNGLKLYSHSERLRKNIRRKEKDGTKEHKLDKVRKICLMGVDQSTNDTIHSLLKGMNPSLQEINGRIGEGKESLIYYSEKIPCILKLYKLDYFDFKYQERNIIDDYRYKNRYNSKMNKFNIICLWAEKERDNLAQLRKYILCPDPIMLKNNVLIMTFIGNKGKPAKKLNHAKLSIHEYKTAYEQIVEDMKIMYRNARLVHADLSEYNILWHKQKCYFIDLSQAVDITHIDAFEYLKRDCRNIIDFFNRKEIPNIMTKEELFTYITNQDYYDRIGLELLTFKLKDKHAMKS